MSAVTRNPAVKDILQTNKFRLTFDRLPNITYFCQSINLPGVSLSEVPYNTPFVDLYVPGEKIMYDTMNITFLVDEEMRGWEHLHDWIRGMTFPVEFKEYRNLYKLAPSAAVRMGTKLPPQYTDASFVIYSNKNNPTMRIEFKDVFPTMLGSILFNTMDSAENIAVSDASFRFSYYNIIRL